MTYDAHRRLAARMLAGSWDRPSLIATVQRTLKCRRARSEKISDWVLEEWRQPYLPGEAALADLIRTGFAIRQRRIPLPLAPPQGSRPPLNIPELPRLDSPAMLADWLDVTPGQLDWFADCQGRLVRPAQEYLGHYSQTWIAKRRGRRLLEAPRPKLKAIQRRILREILDKVPQHPDAFGFVRGRNCIGAAARHAAEEVVICCDLADFFPSVPASRVHAIFRTLGYPDAVARLLTGLTTTRSPADCVAALPMCDRSLWRRPHLPQGAPTSPALANLAARRLDMRLARLARSLNANYSRYADDLTFSGDRSIAFDGTAPLTELIAEIALECSFRLNPAKTRVMRRGRQQQVTGITVNRHVNLPRAEFDRLKAILTNCRRFGPASQNREGHPAFQAHLNGKVAWAETLNPRRGARLRALFEEIAWP